MRLLLDTNQTLEFSKILDHISTKCVSELGKLRLLNSEPLDDKEIIEKRLSEVSEAREIYLKDGGIPIWSFSDVRTLLNKIEPLDSYLDIEDCQKIQNFLEISADVFAFFTQKSDTYKNLSKYALNIDPLLNITKQLKNTIDPAGSIYDNASSDLKNIRAQIAVVSKQINIKLERIIKKQTEHLQEDYITLRDGRLVIPVREFAVNKIPGIVHGQSATGQTHYVEPMSVVPLNNEIFDLYNQEKREIIRILKRLSDSFRDNKDILLTNQENLIHIDSTQAKSQYSISVNGIAPELNDDFRWDIRQGFHPLLLKKIGKEAVPLTIKVGYDHRMIIITGPNAGGKTVALKTLGLLQLLFQCAFHVPVNEGSRFPICRQLFAVIGDEQSIEDDLSTFSSHVTKLNEIVGQLEHRSLVLVDEIGKGTDPAEGSALAISFLERLNREGIATLVTTHLGELKAFAHKAEKATNAAMQFDFKALSPLFRLEMGVPGSSYAFDISKRLGIDQKILDRARELMGRSHDELESMIVDLTKKQQEYDHKLQDLSLKESEMEGLKSLYSNRSDDLKIKRKQYDLEAREEAQAILKKANQTIENVVREIRESQANSVIHAKGRKEIEKLKEELKDKLSSQKESVSSQLSLKLGQNIFSKRFSVSGNITKIYRDKNQVEIESDGVKLTIPYADIEIAEKEINISENLYNQFSGNPEVTNELDLRGKISEDALIELKQYLDNALNSSWQEVRIIHGKGTGALRSQVHAYLKKNKKIKSYRLGNYGEGDTGVTVIEL